MTTINFPTGSASGSTYTFSNKTWTYDGSVWLLIGGGDLFPYTGSAEISGSLNVIGPVTATSFTGSLLGTASYATSVPYEDANNILANQIFS
jgi:hypothetical protein